MITASRLNLESQALNMAHQAAMNPNAPAAGDAGGFGGGGGGGGTGGGSGDGSEGDSGDADASNGGMNMSVMLTGEGLERCRQEGLGWVGSCVSTEDLQLLCTHTLTCAPAHSGSLPASRGCRHCGDRGQGSCTRPPCKGARTRVHT